MRLRRLAATKLQRPFAAEIGKSQRIPVLESACTALDRYARVCDQFCSRTTLSSFFISTWMIYRIIHQTFRSLCDGGGIGADAASPLRIDDCADLCVMRTSGARCCRPV